MRLVPAGYYSWQINPQLWLGLSVNSPFGLSVSFPDSVGRPQLCGESSQPEDLQLDAERRLPDQRLDQRRRRRADPICQGRSCDRSSRQRRSEPASRPGQSAQHRRQRLGLRLHRRRHADADADHHHRHRLSLGDQPEDQRHADAAGRPAFTPAFSTPGSVNTTLNLPDIVTLGLRQRLDVRNGPLLGTVEWSNWSRIGTVDRATSRTARRRLIGGTRCTLPFQYSDGWFYLARRRISVERPQLAVRGGVGFEKSPITDQVRTPRLPDNDRTLAVGRRDL